MNFTPLQKQRATIKANTPYRRMWKDGIDWWVVGGIVAVVGSAAIVGYAISRALLFVWRVVL